MKINRLTMVVLIVLNTAMADTSHNPIAAQYPLAKQLVSEMSLDQKLGQMLMPTFSLLVDKKACKQAGLNDASKDELTKACGLDKINTLHLGAVLAGGDYMAFNTNRTDRNSWRRLALLAAKQYNGPSGTQLLLSTDGVHGNQHVARSILFPHNIGLGAMHNPELVNKIAEYTAEDIIISGFNWNLAPTVAIAQDYRWGRTYESYSANKDVVTAYAQAYIDGLQRYKDKRYTGTLSSAKHFLGDGATMDGVDEGNVIVTNNKQYWQQNIPGFIGALTANSATVMISFHSTNGIPMHFGGNNDWINKYKKEFTGFVVSDFNGVTRSQYIYNQYHQDKIDYQTALAKTINAGVDMLMVGVHSEINPFAPLDKQKKNFYTLEQLIQILKNTINNGLISMERIDEAVTRIIAVKLIMDDGQPHISENVINNTDQDGLALQAAQQSLVLLKNDNKLIPVDKNNIKNVILLGYTNNIGIQAGGWTITGLGTVDNKYWSKSKDSVYYASHASSIEDGLRNLLGPDVNFIHADQLANDHGQFNKDNTLIITAIGEKPYVESMGDVANNSLWYRFYAQIGISPYITLPQPNFLGIQFTENEANIIQKYKDIPVITILFSGRPMIITEGKQQAPLNNSDAFIAAWLPGTAGGMAIASSIFGQYKFKSHCNKIANKEYCSNTLPFAWPASMNEVRSHHYSQFPAQFGLDS